MKNKATVGVDGETLGNRIGSQKQTKASRFDSGTAALNFEEVNIMPISKFPKTIKEEKDGK